jgi:hypothetical protein
MRTFKILVFSLLTLTLACNRQTNEKGSDKIFADSLSNDSVFPDYPNMDKQLWAFSEMGDTIIKSGLFQLKA